MTVNQETCSLYLICTFCSLISGCVVFPLTPLYAKLYREVDILMLTITQSSCTLEIKMETLLSFDKGDALFNFSIHQHYSWSP